MNDRFHIKKMALALCAVVAMACEGGMNSPVSPSAVTGSSSALNSDGSNLKATSPLPVFPLFESTNNPATPTLTARAGTSRYQRTSFSQRFQVSADDFATIAATGMGSVDASGVARYTVDPALTAGRRYVWRVRAEMNDGVGPWSNVMAFTVVGGTTPVPGPGGSGPRTPDPAPGTRLPLPDMQGVLAQFSNAADSCPRGLKYVNNPWQDRVIDAFRQRDTRWGYNGKPTRTAADNNGVPVVAAGDEAAYHYSGGADQGNTEVHLVDLLGGHCGPTPTITWRVFTGEEPGFWTGAGRF
ncbi:MAG TPA: hypothetical protein VL919_04280 [Vicinamibacterales bacterium]|jgi:hypothetical protein|nr:hypothetical protein [Vicinamibacterales bacterium]